MMEKYGVDMSDLPVTDDQKKVIRNLQGKNVTIYPPKNRKQAEELIEKLEKESSE